jgi:hypothetical protein
MCPKAEAIFKKRLSLAGLVRATISDVDSTCLFSTVLQRMRETEAAYF